MYVSPAAEMASGYSVPEWSSKPSKLYKFEVIKNGVVIDNYIFGGSKELIAFGRSPDSDFLMEHESISRKHAILQFSADSCFIFDLGSSHGTFVNKTRIDPHKYVEVKPGFMIRFGQSSRSYVLSFEEVSEAEEWEKDPINFLKRWSDKSNMEIVYETESHDGEFSTIVMVSFLALEVEGPLSKTKRESETTAALKMCEVLKTESLLDIKDGKFFEDNQEDDIFFDRTRKIKKPRVENLENIDTLLEKEKILKEQVSRLEHLLNKDELDPNDDPISDDEVSLYMSELLSDQNKSDMARYSTELKDAKLELERTRELIRFVDPTVSTSLSVTLPVKKLDPIPQETLRGVKTVLPPKSSPDKPNSPTLKEDLVEDWLPPEAPSNNTNSYGY